jgi:hypothetical protein
MPVWMDKQRHDAAHQDIERWLPKIGLWANRPPVPAIYQRYFSTDFRCEFVYDGAAWRQCDVPEWTGGFPTIPASPPTQPRVYRSDRGLEYYYDGTRWLSSERFILTGTLKPQNPAATANSLTTALTVWMLFGHPDNSSDVYIESFFTQVLVQTTNNGTNFWGISVKTRNQATVTTNTYTGNTSTGAIDTLIPITVAVNAVLTRSNFFDAIVDITITGAPGTLFWDPIYMSCRLVG